MKKQFKFSFIYPITQGKVDLDRKGGWKYDHVTDLLINGIGYNLGGNVFDPVEERFDFDIEEVLFEGKNVYPLLQGMEALSDIEDACFHHVHHLATDQESEYEIPVIGKEQFLNSQGNYTPT